MIRYFTIICLIGLHIFVLTNRLGSEEVRNSTYVKYKITVQQVDLSIKFVQIGFYGDTKWELYDCRIDDESVPVRRLMLKSQLHNTHQYEIIRLTKTTKLELFILSENTIGECNIGFKDMEEHSYNPTENIFVEIIR